MATSTRQWPTDPFDYEGTTALGQSPLLQEPLVPDEQVIDEVSTAPVQPQVSAATPDTNGTIPSPVVDPAIPQVDETGEIVTDQPVLPMSEAGEKGVIDTVVEDVVERLPFAREMSSFIKGASEDENFVRYIAERTGYGASTMGDLITYPLQLFSNITPEVVLENYMNRTLAWINGEEIPDWESPGFEWSPISETYEDVLTSTYEKLGVEDTSFVKPSNNAVRSLGLLAENVGAGGVGKSLQMAVRKSRGLTNKLWDDFTKAEIVAASTGAAVGGTFAEMAKGMGGDERVQEQMAALGNLTGAVGSGFASLSPLSIAYRTYKNVRGRMEGGVSVLSEKDHALIAKDAMKLLPAHAVPEFEANLEMVKRIQQAFPEFRPTFAGLYNSPQTLHYQNKTDASNPLLSSEIYAKNREILSQIVEEFGTQGQGAANDLTQFAMDSMRRMGVEHANNLNTEAATLQAKLVEKFKTAQTTGDYSGVDELRSSIVAKKAELLKHQDQMYADVDPNNLTRFNADDFKADMLGIIDKEVNNFASGLRDFDDGLPGSNIFKRPVTRLDDAGKEVKEQGEFFTVIDNWVENLHGSLGTNNELTYESLTRVRKWLNQKYDTLDKAEGYSEAKNIIPLITKRIEALFDETFLSDATPIGDAYRAAKSVHKDVLRPQFVISSSIGTRLLAQDRTGDFKMRVDKIVPALWGDTINARKLDEIISTEFGISDPKLTEAASDLLNTEVSSYAVDNLRKALDAATPEKLSQVYQTWIRKNQKSLEEFPHVQAEIDDFGRTVSLYQHNVDGVMQKLSKVNNQIINRYVDESPVVWLDDLISSDPYTATQRMKQLFYGIGVREPYLDMPGSTGTPNEMLYELENLIQDLATKNPDLRNDILKLRAAISKEALSSVVRHVASPDGKGGVDAVRMQSIFSNSGSKYRIDTLDALLTGEDRITLENLNGLSKIPNSFIEPTHIVTLDTITDLEKRFGTSISTVGNRMWASAINKVGPFWLAADGTMRLFKGVHAEALRKKYTDIMYDMNVMEEVLKARKADMNEKALRAAQRAKEQGLPASSIDPEVDRSDTEVALEAIGLIKGTFLAAGQKIKTGSFDVRDLITELHEKQIFGNVRRWMEYLESIEPEEENTFEGSGSSLVNGMLIQDGYEGMDELLFKQTEEDLDDFQRFLRAEGMSTEDDPLMIEVTGGATEEEETTNE